MQLSVTGQVGEGVGQILGGPTDLFYPGVRGASPGRKGEQGHPGRLGRQTLEGRGSSSGDGRQLLDVGVGDHATVPVGDRPTVGQNEEETAAHQACPGNHSQHSQPGPHHVGAGPSGSGYPGVGSTRCHQYRGSHHGVAGVESGGGGSGDSVGHGRIAEVYHRFDHYGEAVGP